MVPGRAAILIADTDGTDPVFDAADWFEAAIGAVEDHTVDPAVYAVAGPHDGRSRGARWRSAFDAARADGADHVVMMEPGIFPIDDTWLPQLIEQTDGGATIAGISRMDGEDRRLTTCVCATASLVDSLAIDFDASSSPLSAVVDAAVAAGTDVRGLHRSNRNALHEFPGALYGDILYDHGIESWPMAREDALDDGRAKRALGTDLALHRRGDFVEWMRGDRIDGRVFFVLGMHRSGTSALMAGLEQCGLFLGKTFRTPLPDHPNGNFERPDSTSINDQLLAEVGASWQHPPAGPIAAGGAALDAVMAELRANAPGGVKDPRLLYTLDSWLAAAGRPGFIGSFRHPAAVAKSLWERDRIAPADGYRLWSAYNSRLVELHRKYEFPLVEFEPFDRLGYSRRVAGAAAELGLCPRIHAVIDVLADPADEPATAEESELPADADVVWRYLREHRYEDPIAQESFVGLALAWESTTASKTIARPAKRGLQWPHRLGRRLPRSMRRQLWRLWCKIVGTPQPR